jgi:hypothetical protein
MYGGASPSGRVESCIEAAVHIQTRYSWAQSAAHPGKASPDQDFAVRLQRDCQDVGIRAGIECCVNAAVCVQPRDVVAVHAVHRRERAPNYNLSVRLHDR